MRGKPGDEPEYLAGCWGSLHDSGGHKGLHSNSPRGETVTLLEGSLVNLKEISLV